jgi:Short C-terminal domain/Phospholipase_D-nuclease N-terminal
MSLWDAMVSIFWFMLLVAWFWLLIAIISDVFRDEDLSGVAKAAWCIFVVLLPWIGVLSYMIARGRSMNERTAQQAVRHEQAFRSYVRDVAVSERVDVTGELKQLGDLRDRGVLTPEEFDQAKQRVLGSAGTPAAPSHAATVG